jgi:hypothetical protein
MERNKNPGVFESEITRKGEFLNFAFWIHRSEGIEKLVTWWTMCVENNCDFVEIRSYSTDSILYCFKQKHVSSNFCLTHVIQ